MGHARALGGHVNRKDALWDYLRGMAKRKAETRFAEVDAVRSDGNYWLLDGATGERFIATPGTVGGTLSKGQTVTVSKPDGSGRSSGTGYSIIGVQTTNGRNSSLTSRVTDENTTSAESLARIVSGGVTVTSVQLVKGGAAVTVLLYGVGLATAAVYGDAGITDNVAQVITSTLITIQPKASGGMAVGRYSLTVAGVTIPNFFEVT